jgi:hypothetical protein
MLRRGDVLVVRWVDRLGRNYADVVDTIREFMRPLGEFVIARLGAAGVLTTSKTAPQWSVVLRVRRRWQLAESVSRGRGRAMLSFEQLLHIFRPSARNCVVHSRGGGANTPRGCARRV